MKIATFVLGSLAKYAAERVVAYRKAQKRSKRGLVEPSVFDHDRLHDKVKQILADHDISSDAEIESTQLLSDLRIVAKNVDDFSDDVAQENFEYLREALEDLFTDDDGKCPFCDDAALELIELMRTESFLRTR